MLPASSTVGKRIVILPTGHGDSACHGHRDYQDNIGSETRFIWGAVEFNHAVVDRSLIQGIQATQCSGYLRFHISDSFQNSFAALAFRIAIAQFRGLALPG
jgi:hypothetical protein